MTAMKSTVRGATREEEGPMAKMIERQTAKIPSDWFLWAALGAMATSAFLQARRREQQSLFVGEWVPTMLIFGLYNKIVKRLGSEAEGVPA